MDANRFDVMTRVLGEASSRRTLITAITAVTAVLAPWPGVAARAAKKKKAKKKKNKKQAALPPPSPPPPLPPSPSPPPSPPPSQSGCQGLSCSGTCCVVPTGVTVASLSCDGPNCVCRFRATDVCPPPCGVQAEFDVACATPDLATILSDQCKEFGC
jgi:hypothetical protein